MGAFDFLKNTTGLGFLDSMYEDPSKNAQQYLNRVPGTVKPYYDPFIETGRAQLPGLQNEYNSLIKNPGGRLNEIGQGYHQSPGFDFALKQALQASGNAAAAGGMAGSPQHEQQNMGVATGLANQDFNSWIKNALGLYGTGMEGSQGLYNQGYTASDSLARILAEQLGSQASLGYAGGANRNMMNMGTLAALLGAGGSAMGAGMGGM